TISRVSRTADTRHSADRAIGAHLPDTESVGLEDVQIILPINCQPLRPVQLRLSSGPAVSAISCRSRANYGRNQSGRRTDFSDLLAIDLGNVEIPVLVDGEPPRSAELYFCCRRTVGILAASSVVSDDAGLCVDLAYAVFIRVGYVDVSLLVNRHPPNG